MRGRSLPMIIVLAVILIGAAALTAYLVMRAGSLDSRYSDMAWREKEWHYERQLTRSNALPEHYSNLKIITDIQLTPGGVTGWDSENSGAGSGGSDTENDGGDNVAPVRRLLYSYDYGQEHCIVYADAEWRSKRIVIEPLLTDASPSEGPAFVLCAAGRTDGGESVYYGEVYDPGAVSVKAHILISTADSEPVYLSDDYVLRNGGFMIEGHVEQLWLRNEADALHEIDITGL